jgi:YihY family inner membrane protein
VTEVPESGTPSLPQTTVNNSVQGTFPPDAVLKQDPAPPAEEPKWYRWRKDGTALIKYLLDSEVHTFAFSVAANAILSFVPFIVLLYTLAQSVFHSSAMVVTITDMVKYFFPADIRNQYMVANNLALVASNGARHGIQAFSVIMILVACTGIFLPLEVALNQAWGVTKSRNYISNQIVALGLSLLMVVLGFAAIFTTTVATALFSDVLQGHSGWIGSVGDFSYSVLHFLVLAISTGIASILFFFSIYFFLPNRKVPWKPVLRTSIITGLIWLVSKYLFVEFLLPHLDLGELYGRFSVSVGLIFWSYTSGLILFAGAQFSVSKLGIGLRD